MDEMEDRRVRTKHTGCAQAAVIGTLLLWLGAMPAGVVFLTNRALGRTTSPGVMAAVVIAVSAVVLLGPFVGVALLTRRQAGWKATAAAAAGLVAIAGYLLLDATVRTVLPPTPALPLQGEGVWLAVLRLGLLVPYTLLAAWLAPRLAGAAPRRLGEWLGLHRFDGPTMLLALAVAALVTLPWPVTGALGDSITSLALAFQALAWAVPQVLLFWGVVFCLLTSTFGRAWVAALTTILVYGLFTLGGVLPVAGWSVLLDLVILLPLALLLTELRARESGTYPLLPVALFYRATPLLFVDPRDAIAQDGLPELQHILSYAIVVVTAGVLGLVLWSGRRLLLVLRERVRVPVSIWPIASALTALVMWSLWGGLYVFAGEPGFANDGFLIILEEQADGSTEPSSRDFVELSRDAQAEGLAEVLSATRTISDREARLRYVHEALIETAERTQGDLRAELDKLGVPYRPYYIINMIRVDGHRWLMHRFEGRPGVAQVVLNPNVREYPHRIPFPGVLPDGGDDELPEGVQPNLTAIHADEAWALGVTGEGIIVAGQDTGYDWTHPALKSHYRGWDGQNADHDYNWHDAWDDTAEPFDDGSHGTHTMGTVLGDDGADNLTGVAPDAQWIGCRNMRRGFGNPGSYAECMEFFLAPYPHGGDPFTDGDVALAPHLVNNSWGCPDIEGCFPDTLEPAVEVLWAAGMMMVASVGNDGPACGTATTPPANYDGAFSVGAATDAGEIVGFSSRGPVDGLIKPDVTAPGDYVRSSVPGGGYGWAGGTSMAGPHVTGLVALLWSVQPALIGDMDATESLICRTAVPKRVENVCTTGDEVPEGAFAALLYNPVCACGDVTGVPNNIYGCGFIDAGAAVRAALGQ